MVWPPIQRVGVEETGSEAAAASRWARPERERLSCCLPVCLVCVLSCALMDWVGCELRSVCVTVCRAWCVGFFAFYCMIALRRHSRRNPYPFQYTAFYADGAQCGSYLNLPTAS